MWLDNLKKMKANSGFTTKEIADKSGIPEPTLEKLFSGATKDPKLATMQQLVKFFGFTLDDLIGNTSTRGELLTKAERSHIKKYRLLDPYGKEAVDGVLDVEYRRCEVERQTKAAALRESREQLEIAKEPEVAEEAIYILPYYLHPSSAGTGEYSDGDEWEELTLRKRPPRGASYVVRVHGDSMEPTYRDGDKVFVRAGADIRLGQIGIFIMGGEQYVKELGDGVLISHNSEYDPRPMTADIRCQGLVLGICDEEYYIGRRSR